MAASSSTQRRPLLLPQTKSKTKIRRRAWIFKKDCFTKQIRILVLFAIAISSIAIFKIGFPHTLVTRSSSNSSSFQAYVSSLALLNATEVKEAQVDIQMSELYDEIEFRDLDGGAWKQGWDVKYRGDEWDKKKLRVFVVPHS